MQVLGRHKTLRIAAEAARKKGLPRGKERPHMLLLFAELSATENQYRLSLKQEDQKAIAPGIARGLLDRDVFIATSMAIGLVPVPVISNKAYYTAAAPVFFPDPNVFAEAAGTATLSEAQALESVYWGTTSLKTNEGMRIDKNPNLPFRTVQQTQASASTQNMFTGLEFKEIGAAVRFGGGDENEIILDLKCDDKTHIAGTAARKNLVMIALDGAIIKGATTKLYTT